MISTGYERNWLPGLDSENVKFQRVVSSLIAALRPDTNSDTNTMDQAVTIKKYPTRLHLRCRGCAHEAQLAIFLSEVQRLRCSRCGSRNVNVISRDRLAAWSTRRRGVNGAK